jgi:hypothetical protein
MLWRPVVGNPSLIRLGKGSPLSGTDPDRFSQVSSHYEFLATTIRMTADTVHIAVAKWRLLQVNWRDSLVPSTDVDI